LEEELSQCKSEIDKYKIEMTKNEENLKKALMRGVCALNMEAMSIFSDTNGKGEKPVQHNLAENIPITVSYNDQPHYPQLSATTNNLLKTLNNPTHMSAGSEHHLGGSHYQPSYYPNSASMYTTTTTAASKYKSALSESKDMLDRHHVCKLSERESKDLCKKVKNYCESSLKKSSSIGATAALSASNENLNNLNTIASKYNSTNYANNNATNGMSALSRAKMQLLNSTSHQEQHQHYTNVNSEATYNDYSSKSGGSSMRKYDELIEHPLPPQNVPQTFRFLIFD
jgi:hypothetical protein